MAGGWHHITNDDGSYYGANLLENGGDVEEFAEHVYGMVWYLAKMLELRSNGIPVQQWIEDAARNYSMGVSYSPDPTLGRDE